MKHICMWHDTKHKVTAFSAHGAHVAEDQSLRLPHASFIYSGTMPEVLGQALEVQDGGAPAHPENDTL